MLQAEPRKAILISDRAWLRRPDQLVAIAATALIVLLHVCLAPNLGGLWRDEVNTVNLATLPIWSDVWTFHNQDSFPLLFAALVRLWAVVFGSGDGSLRVLGSIIGLGVVAASWVSARLLKLRFPFWSLALVGANPLVIRYGDSMRAYGLGLLLLLLMFGAVWKFVSGGERMWFLLASCSAVLAVHAVYYNAVLLFAVCMGGCAVAAQERKWRRLLAILAIGIIAACTMLPYVPTFLHANDWNFLVQFPFTLSWMLTCLKEVMGSPYHGGAWLWIALVASTLVVAGWTFWQSFGDGANTPELRQVVTFSAVAFVVGIVAYFGFLKLLSYHTQSWYYMALLAFAAACIDRVVSAEKSKWHQRGRAAVVTLFLAITTLPAIEIISSRHTNIDLAAEALRVATQPGDLILLTRWECSVTMNRYYKGAAEWMTIPPLADFRFQAYQPIMAEMQAEDPLRPIRERAEQTLRSGHRVWILGEVPPVRPNEAPPSLPRVVDPSSKWRGSPLFYSVWVMQVSHFLQNHVTESGLFPSVSESAVSPFEDLPVHFVSGWR